MNYTGCFLFGNNFSYLILDVGGCSQQAAAAPACVSGTL
jgi:hypothetical protein